MTSISRPTLLINEDICRRNILRMAEKAKLSGVVFRPHFKTHQSEIVADWFRDQGISAITVSSAEMALKFAEAGWDDITIAFPANLRETNYYNELASKITLNLLVDSPLVALQLGTALKFDTGVFIEIDCGYPRSGVPVHQTAVINEIISIINTSDHLKFRGFLTHAGHTYAASGQKEIIEIFNRSISLLLGLKREFTTEEFIPVLSLGDTPGCSLADSFEGIDEVRPGNFVYYDVMQYYLGSCQTSDIAVTVACPVTGIYPDRNEIVIYGGAVHLSKDYIDKDGKCFGLVVEYSENDRSGPLAETRVISLSQEHGIIRTTSEIISKIKHGDLLGILPVHSCLTADLLKDNVRIV
ncbi:MAG TPA: alanine racemase [Bacteroidales bacterium]|nr:alanine racemase [Bacteroidales bacterium]